MAWNRISRVGGLLAAVALTLALGCSGGQTPEEKATEQAKALGVLPGLRAAPDQSLQDELARVIDDGGTPEQLAANIPDDVNIAAGLIALFEGIKRTKLAVIRAESEKLFPTGPFTMDPVQREKAVRFRRRYNDERLGARLALDRPECRFPVAYEAGPADELVFLDMIWICSRLEAFQAAEALAAADVDTAIQSLGYMFRLAECLAAEPQPIVRLEGAFLRTEAFLVLQAIAGHDALTRRHVETIHGWLARQLQSWPDDALAWIGDRALGMVFYEAIRGGRLDDFLTEEEEDSLAELGSHSAFLSAALKNVNTDELYYLIAMRRIIASCEHPYHTRVEHFEQLRCDLHTRRNEPDFPIVAARFLLLDIEKGHIIQARDRANCEGWLIAAAHSCGAALPSVKINPLTGRPYTVESEGGTIMVFDIGTGADGDNPPWIIPDLSSEALP